MSFSRKLEITRHPEDPKGVVVVARSYEHTLASSKAITCSASIRRVLKLDTN